MYSYYSAGHVCGPLLLGLISGLLLSLVVALFHFCSGQSCILNIISHSFMLAQQPSQAPHCLLLDSVCTTKKNVEQKCITHLVSQMNKQTYMLAF